MDRNNSIAAAFGDLANSSVMPPPPLPSKRRRQENQKMSDTSNTQNKRRRSSTTVSIPTREHRISDHQSTVDRKDAGGFTGILGEGGRGGNTRDTRDTRAVGSGKPGGAGLGAAHEEGVSGESRPRHFPVIGSFKPPPRPTRGPLRSINNTNKHNNTKNTQNYYANYTRGKKKNEEIKQAQVKNTVTYVENQKGELEIIKYKNLERGSVVAFSPEVDAEGQHQEDHQHQLGAHEHQEQDENEYHELRCVQPSKRDYRRELYHLFKSDLRDWELQLEVLKQTEVERENIGIDPRLLNMEKPKFGMTEKDVGSQPAKDFFKTPRPTTPLQQVVQQLRAREPQSGQQLGEQGGLGICYSQRAGNGADNNNNNVGGANAQAYYGGVPAAFVVNNNGSGAYKSPYAQNAAGGAAVNNSYGIGNNASAGPRTPVNQIANVANGVMSAVGGAAENNNGGYRNIAPEPPRIRQQPTNTYGFPNDVPLYQNRGSPVNQHGVGNFVALINDEEHRQQARAQLREDMEHLASGGMPGPSPLMGLGLPQYPLHNFQLPNPYEHQQSTGLGQENSDFGQYAQAGPGQFLQPHLQLWDARAASPALFMQPPSRTVSPFPQWEDAQASFGSFADSPHQYHPFPSGGSLEHSYHEHTGFAASPPQQRGVFSDESVDQIRQGQNAFAMQEADTEMGGFSPYRGSTEYEGVPLSPLTFPVQLPEHTFQAQNAIQQTFARNGQLYGGGVPGPQYAPSHGFIDSGEVPNAPVFQLDTRAMEFFNDWNTLGVVRERFEANMIAQYPPRPVSLQAVPMGMPMSAQIPMGMPLMPPMPMYPPVQTGFQQQSTYGGPRHPMLPQQQFYNSSSIGNSYACGGSEIGPSNVPYPSQAFQFNPRSPEFSPRASPMSSDFGQPVIPQPSRQQVIDSQDTPNTFISKQHRRRNSFENLLYTDHLAKEALARDAQKLDSLNGRMTAELSPKSVAESYQDPPQSANRLRGHNAKRTTGRSRGLGAHPLAGFTQRAIQAGAAEKSLTSAHALGMADKFRDSGAMGPPPRPLANLATDAADLASPHTYYDSHTGLATLNGVTLSREEQATANMRLNHAINRTSGGGRGTGVARGPPAPSPQDEILAVEMNNAKKHSAGLETIFRYEKMAVENEDLQVHGKERGASPALGIEVPALPTENEKPELKKKGRNSKNSVAAEPPMPAVVPVIPRENHMHNDARLRVPDEVAIARATRLVTVSNPWKTGVFDARALKESVAVATVNEEGWCLMEDEEFAEDIADDKDYGEAIVASGDEAGRRQSMQPRVEDAVSDTEMGGVAGSREA